MFEIHLSILFVTIYTITTEEVLTYLIQAKLVDLAEVLLYIWGFLQLFFYTIMKACTT